MDNLRVIPAGSRTITGRVRRYLLFEDWTWSDPETAARHRVSWPAWRRAIRPVAAALWWTGVIIGAIVQPTWRSMSPPARVCWSAALVIIGGCVVLGVVDGFRQRRTDRLRRDT
jgi:hypothetical protein